MAWSTPTIWQVNDGTTSATRYYEGDADLHGDVDLDDRAIWDSAQGLVAPPAVIRGDFNGNGIVDATDYSLWVDSRGSTTNLVADGNGIIGLEITTSGSCCSASRCSTNQSQPLPKAVSVFQNLGHIGYSEICLLLFSVVRDLAACGKFNLRRVFQ